MKAGDNKEFWQRTAKSYGPFMKHSGKLYDAICERIPPGLTREMNVLELACGSGQLSFRLVGRVRLWARLLTLAGFKVYSKWTEEGFERFVSEHNFQIRQAALLGGSLAPLCYLEASVKK